MKIVFYLKKYRTKVKCFVVIIYYALTNGVKFSNNVEYKDIFTLLINILFVFFISNSISKNYDSQRKKKDLLIDEVKSFLGNFRIMER